MDVDQCVSLKRRATDNIHSIFATTSSPSTKRAKVNKESLDAYCEVLKSYALLEWGGSAISPRELASHGWRSTGHSNCVQCISCQKFLCTNLPSILSVDALTYAKCLKSMRKDLSAAHSLTCVYRSVLVDFHEFDADVDFVRKTVLERVKNYIREPYFDGEEEETSHRSLLDQLSDIVPELSSFHKNSLLSALCNWRQFTRSICGGTQCVMFCDHCNRNVALSANPNFDPLKSHYKWCPTLDKDSEGVFYYQRRLECLKNKHEPVLTQIPTAALGLVAAKKLRMTLSALMHN